jgi:hypothetical protein
MRDSSHSTRDDLAALAQRFEAFGRECEQRAPLYARLSTAISGDTEVIDLLTSAPPEQQLPVLLLAAVHDSVLADPTCELASHYPNVTTTPRTDDPWPAFRTFALRREDRIRRCVATRSTQTNEVGRCAVLLPVLAALSAEHGPLAHVDIGASAGLNMLIDRFSYEYEPGGTVGDPSPVHLHCGVRGAIPVPAEVPTIGARIGLDRTPIVIEDPAAVRWLRACVWPDQRDRFVRLDAALRLAADSPPRLVTGDVVDAVGSVIGHVVGSGHPVVTTTWVLNYLDPEQRRRFVSVLDGIGARLDLSWVSIEAPALTQGLPQSIDGDEQRSMLALVTWRGGERVVRRLATCHPHGYWLHWNPQPSEPTATDEASPSLS